MDCVASVIHFDPPEDQKAYLHRSGRTARAGQTGLVVSLIQPGQHGDIKQIKKQLGLNQPITSPDHIDASAAPARPHRRSQPHTEDRDGRRSTADPKTAATEPTATTTTATDADQTADPKTAATEPTATTTTATDADQTADPKTAATEPTATTTATDADQTAGRRVAPSSKLGVSPEAAPPPDSGTEIVLSTNTQGLLDGLAQHKRKQY